MRSCDVRVGISGWTYPPWRGVFYPPDLSQKRELEFASRQLSSIEINGSFYFLQLPSSYEKWHDQTPDDFVFAVKGGRFITHMKRLKEIRVPLATFFASGLFALRRKLGPILWQFPPQMIFDPTKFEAFFKLLPRTTDDAAKLSRENTVKKPQNALVKTTVAMPMRYAVEIRHPSFESKAFTQLCRAHNIAIVVADTAGKWPMIDEYTSDFRYLRLHGDEQLYVSGYTDEALDDWARKVDKWRKRCEVFVYFNNDVKVRAPIDAINLSRRLNVRCGEIGGSFETQKQRKPQNLSIDRDNRWNFRPPPAKLPAPQSERRRKR